MNLLGIDPGATTGWCLYDPQARRVVDRGTFEKFHVPEELIQRIRNGGVRCVVESFDDVHAGIYPQTVHAAEVLGRIEERILCLAGQEPGRITRFDVKRTLHNWIMGEWPVQKDRDVWAALLKLHGGIDAAKKGGPLHGAKAHERAALAVVVAYSLPLVPSA